MSDNDLIRRGDAREILEDEGFLERSLERLAAIPAVQPTVSPELLATTNDVVALVEALEFYAAWEMEEMEPPTDSEIDLFDGIFDCPMPKAFSDRGEIARAALRQLEEQE